MRARVRGAGRIETAAPQVALVVATVAVLAGALAARPVSARAAAGEGERQVASLTFGSTAPATSTGAQLSIEFRDPASPDAKPHAVAAIVLELPSGTVFDTAAVAQCGTSDAELIAQGEAACPASSRIGSGTLITDTGSIGGLPRLVANRLTQFNNADESITLAESEDPQTRVVSRARISGRTVEITVPPVPGGPPPEPFTAFKSFELAGEPAGTSAKPYLRTPSGCPPEGHWTTRMSFTYRDGVSETVESTTPCKRPSAADHKGPRIRLRGIPRGERCARRGFRVRARAVDRDGVRRLSIRLDGKRVRSKGGKRARAFIKARRIPAGRHLVEVRARDGAGNLRSHGFGFRRCGRS